MELYIFLVLFVPTCCHFLREGMMENMQVWEITDIMILKITSHEVFQQAKPLIVCLIFFM